MEEPGSRGAWRMRIRGLEIHFPCENIDLNKASCQRSALGFNVIEIRSCYGPVVIPRSPGRLLRRKSVKSMRDSQTASGVA